MKKNYFLTLLLTFVFSVFSYAQSPVITMISDGDCSGGTPKVLEIYANGTVNFAEYTLQNQTNANTTWGANQDLSALGTVTDAFVYIVKDADLTIFNAEFPSLSSATILVSNTVNVNGDDRVRIIKTSDSSVIDQYGVEGTDGTGEDWEYKDGYAKRNDGTAANAGSFSSSNWTNGNNDLNGQGTCQSGPTFESIIGVGTYTATASTNPSITITAPSNNSVLTNVTTATVSVSTSNFTVGSVGGSGVDGHIHWTVQENSDAAVAQPMKYDLNDEVINVTAGNTYTVFMQLVDNTHTPISPAVNTTTTFTVEHPCDLQLGTITKSCDATTSGADTYTTSIAFTGGGTSTYTLNADNGAISGDDPSTATDGTIIISGVTEGTDIVFTAMGDSSNSTCDLTRNISSPSFFGLY